MSRKRRTFDEQVKELAAQIHALTEGGVRVAGGVIILSVDTETDTEARHYPFGNAHAIDGAVEDYLSDDEPEMMSAPPLEDDEGED